jgi:hypothetical protein
MKGIGDSIMECLSECHLEDRKLILQNMIFVGKGACLTGKQFFLCAAL